MGWRRAVVGRPHRGMATVDRRGRVPVPNTRGRRWGIPVRGWEVSGTRVGGTGMVGRWRPVGGRVVTGSKAVQLAVLTRGQGACREGLGHALGIGDDTVWWPSGAGGSFLVRVAIGGVAADGSVRTPTAIGGEPGIVVAGCGERW